MGEEKRRSPENRAEKPESKKRSFSLSTIFYHNTFVLAFSLCVALITWFGMSMGNSGQKTMTLYDVPILVKYSEAAEEDGLRVFNMSYNTADLEISGNSLITNKLSQDDFEVSVTLNPTSTKLTGNTLQKMTVPVRAVKSSSLSDYAIASISPEEINVEFDRYKETSFPIESEVKYSAESGYYAGTAVLSEESVTISGPESSVNKISRATVNYTFNSPLRADENVVCPIRLYDQNNQEIADTTGMYLSMSVDSIGVTIPILPKKTVTLVANTVHQPKGFASSRITVEPAQIDVVGTQEALDGIGEIQLGTAVDFADLTIGEKNVFSMDIALPAGVRNISSVGGEAINQATVSINLNGYEEVTVTVPSENIKLVNVPAGKTPELHTRSVEVRVIGPEAQVAKLTGDSVTLQADLTNFSDRTGMVDLPLSAGISRSGSDSCWVAGKYTAALSLTDKSAVLTDGSAASSDTLVAAPQE